jgi:tetratricopeptide (TPR) repeat protein
VAQKIVTKSLNAAQINFMKKIFLLFVVVIFILPSCSSHKMASNGASKDAVGGLDSKASEDQKMFLDALKAYSLNDIPLAISKLNECIRNNPNNDAAYYQLSKIYIETQKYEPALLFAKNAVKIDSKNKWYQVQYAEALAFNNKLIDAANVYQALITSDPEEEDYYLTAAYLYQKAGKNEEALKIFEKLEAKKGSSEELCLQKQQVYLRMGKVDLAAAELEKLIAENPSEIRYYGMLAELYEANNQSEKAMQTYDRLMKVSPGDGRGYVSMAQFYFRKNDYQHFYETLSKCIESKELAADMKIGMLGLLIQKAAIDSTKMLDALAQSNSLVANNPKEARSYAIRGDVYAQLHKTNEAMLDYKKSLSLETKEFGVWQQLFFMMSDLKQNDSLEMYTAKGIQLFPEQALCYFFNGFANGQLKNYSKAIKSLKRGIPMCGDNSQLQAQFYSSLGDTYHTLKQHNASDSAYDKALELKPDDAFVMNNYAYFLSVRNINLDKAELLSKKSNMIQPRNTSFQDTYGWIMFQQKKYFEAKEWIEKAYINGGDKNATILEHLGDINYFLKDITKAVEFWKSAKQAGAKGQIDKKIAESKYYEEVMEE